MAPGFVDPTCQTVLREHRSGSLSILRNVQPAVNRMSEPCFKLIVTLQSSITCPAVISAEQLSVRGSNLVLVIYASANTSCDHLIL